MLKKFFVWGCCVTFVLGVWVSSPFLYAYVNLTNQADNSARLKPTALKIASVNFIAGNNSTSFGNNNQAKCPEGTTFRNGVCLQECSATTYPHTTKPDTTSGEVTK